MTTLYQPFEAEAIIHSWFKVSVSADVLPQQAVASMCVHAGNTEVYITKQQAMDFFGLVDGNDVPSADFLEEAAAILQGTKPMRFPIVDELQGFAGMLRK